MWGTAGRQVRRGLVAARQRQKATQRRAEAQERLKALSR